MKEQAKSNIVWRMFKWLFLMIVSGLPAGLALLGLELAIQDNTEATAWWIAGATLVMILLIMWLLWRNYYPKISQTIKNQPMTLKDVGINAGLYVLMRLWVVGGTYFMEVFYGKASFANDEALSGSGDFSFYPFAPFMVFLLAIGLLIPIIEEIVYRGQFTEIVMNGRQTTLTLIISSVIFSFNHIVTNVVEFIVYFGMGAIMYYAYARRGNLKDSILIHLFNNGFIALYSLADYFGFI